MTVADMYNGFIRWYPFYHLLKPSYTSRTNVYLVAIVKVGEPLFALFSMLPNFGEQQ